MGETPLRSCGHLQAAIAALLKATAYGESSMGTGSGIPEHSTAV
jgi:hypothetical protein